MKITQTVYQEGNEGCIVLLPGRGGHSKDLKQFYSLENCKIIGFDNPEKQWYAKPNGPQDQNEAIITLNENIKFIKEEIEKIGMPKNKIAVVGFSAGGVAAIWTVINDKEEYALAMAHSGAILDIKNIPLCKFNKMPIMLAHGKQDDVFGYEERFVPAVEALRNKNYSVCKISNPQGRHNIDQEDADIVESILKHHLYRIASITSSSVK